MANLSKMLPYTFLPFALALLAGNVSAQKHLDYPERVAYPLQNTDDTLWVCKSEIDCHILRGDSIISEQMTYTKADQVMKPLSLWGGDDLFLVQVYAGDGCPWLYQIIDATTDKTYVTDGIGNCNEPDAMFIDNETIVFKYSDDPDTKRKGNYFIYSRAKRQVKTTKAWRPKGF